MTARVVLLPLLALVLTGGAHAAEPPQPDNVCEYAYDHQTSVWQGNVPTYGCYARVLRDGCDKKRGFVCAKTPISQTRQCSFPPEKVRRRCIGPSQPGALLLALD